MNRPATFYYADDAGNAVGPLALGEIRRFADAGVVPPGVMVCEAGGEKWRSLDSFDGRGPDRVSVDTHSAELRPSEEVGPSIVVRNLKIAYTVAVVVSLVAFALNTFANRAAVQSGDPWASSGADQLVVVTSLLSVAVSIALIYFLVVSLPQRHRFTTPIKAAGFFAIPVFSIYWVFRLLPGLVDSTRKWWAEIAPEKSRRLMWLVPFALVTAVLWAGSEVFGIFNFFWFAADSPPGNWKGLLFFSGLLYAFSQAAFFQFTLSLVHILRGLVDPEDYEREKFIPKRIPFWKFQRGPWNPEIYAWLFPVVFFAIWLAKVPQ